MNLEEFKVLSKEQIKEYGDKIPLGYEYDNTDNILTYKNSDEYWNEYTYNKNNNLYINKGIIMNLAEFKVATKEYLEKYGETIPLGRQYDNNNNKLTYKHSTGYWNECTYNDNNDELSYKSSNGYWSESTYNDNNNLLTLKLSTGYWDEYTYDENNVLTHKNSNGIDCIYIIKGIEHILWYDIKNKNYIAGCQNLSYNECIEFFDKNNQYHADAELFMKAIEEHHKTVV